MKCEYCGKESVAKVKHHLDDVYHHLCSFCYENYHKHTPEELSKPGSINLHIERTDIIKIINKFDPSADCSEFCVDNDYGKYYDDGIIRKWQWNMDKLYSLSNKELSDLLEKLV